jgi:hypothetical protein
VAEEAFIFSVNTIYFREIFLYDMADVVYFQHHQMVAHRMKT